MILCDLPYGTTQNEWDCDIPLDKLWGLYERIIKDDGAIVLTSQRYPVDVIYFKTAESEGPVYHPTQKPVELARYLIRTYFDEDDIVLDNVCGSGSFLVAAVLEGRRFIGIEKNEDIKLHKKGRVDLIEICNKRIEEAFQKTTNQRIDECTITWRNLPIRLFTFKKHGINDFA